MTAVQRVRRTQQMLGFGVAAQAIAWGVAAALGVLAIISFASLADPDLARQARWHAGVALLSGLLVFVLFLERRHLVRAACCALDRGANSELHYSL